MKLLEKIKSFIDNEREYRTIKNLNRSEYKSFLEKKYFNKTGQKPDLDNPQKYTEKMQYAKVHLHTPLKTKLSDKYEVREWVTDKIGSEYLIPLLGVWDNANDIKFDELPGKFVLKINSGSGTNIIVKDKNKINYLKTKLKLNYWLNRNFAFNGDIQLHYKDIEPKIIAEEYITDTNGELNDYKFMCFDGKVYYCWIDVGRNSTHYRNVYDTNWNLQPWQQNKLENTPYNIEKPKNFDKMIEIATYLSKGFSHVRVDLYNVDGKIYFGEMTFTSAGGYSLMYPEKYNYLVGELWDITGDN